MLRFETRNSTYEVNPTLFLIRRVSGTNPHCDGQPADGDWREFASITLREGTSGIVAWEDVTDPRVNRESPYLTTSRIEKMENDGVPIGEYASSQNGLELVS